MLCQQHESTAVSVQFTIQSWGRGQCSINISWLKRIESSRYKRHLTNSKNNYSHSLPSHRRGDAWLGWLGGLWLRGRGGKLKSLAHLSCPGSLPVGRWGTQPSRGETWSVTQCPSCRSFKGASACLAGDPPLSSSSRPSSKSTAPTSSSRPPWEVGQQSWSWLGLGTGGGWDALGSKLNEHLCHHTLFQRVCCQISQIVLVPVVSCG